MNKNASLILSLIVALTVTVPAWAEKADMTPQQLRETATHVASGKVAAIYERTEQIGDWKYTKYIVEIRVADCEKGDGIATGELLYARYWRRGWTGDRPIPISTIGHRNLPAEGDALRVYLARNAYDGFTTENNDGGFNVIGANGFKKLK